MLGAGGLKGAAKRTAFGDVSNITKPTTSIQDDLVTVGKAVGYDNLSKPSQPLEKSAAFLRPAQRPLTVTGLKNILTGNTQNNSVATATTAKIPQSDSHQSQPQIARPRALSKRSTTVYKDTTATESDQAAVAAPNPATTSTTVPIPPVHQNLGPRHHKSQPLLKVDHLDLHRTQVKNVEYCVDETKKDANVTQSVVEVKACQIEELISRAEEAAIHLREESDRQDRQLSALPLASEPEEYWEEEEEEIYDEQGYTTAHSYRSRGDNTTGGATTLLFPKVSGKTAKELAVAKDIIESLRTAEEIEDEAWDTSMVAEYGDEIFQYMKELEVSSFLIILAPSRPTDSRSS